MCSKNKDSVITTWVADAVSWEDDLTIAGTCDAEVKEYLLHDGRFYHTGKFFIATLNFFAGESQQTLKRGSKQIRLITPMKVGAGAPYHNVAGFMIMADGGVLRNVSGEVDAAVCEPFGFAENACIFPKEGVNWLYARPYATPFAGIDWAWIVGRSSLLEVAQAYKVPADKIVGFIEGLERAQELDVEPVSEAGVDGYSYTRKSTGRTAVEVYLEAWAYGLSDVGAVERCCLNCKIKL